MKITLPIILFLIYSSILTGQPGGETKSLPLFSVMQDSAVSDPFVFFFKDKSTGNVHSWYWEFGDGTTSEKQFPKHRYESPGIYKVCLTVKVMENGEIEEEQICKKVRVAEKGYFNLGGHVFASQMPIEEGLAYLYKFDSANNLYPVDTSVFDTLGYYYFYQKKEGDYIVKAEAAHNLGQYSSYMPTYYGNVTQWQQAEVIHFDTTMWEYNINLARPSYAASGQGIISGSIAYDTNTLRNLNAENIPIYLINQEENRKLCTYSDNDGSFEFDNLASGNYLIHAEITGLESVPVYQNVDEEHNENPGIRLYIKDDKIIAHNGPEGIQLLNKKVSQVYPNPAKNKVKLNFPENISRNIEIKVFDPTGRMIYLDNVKTDNHGNIITINTSNYSPGIYSIQISDKDSGFYRRFLKK